MAYRRTRLMEERLASNREKMLRAARRLVAEGGFRNAQIAAVAAQAGVSTGTIYRYFPSKAELYVEVLTAAVNNEIAILHEVIGARDNARAQLDAAVASFVRRALTGPNLAWAFIAEPAEAEVDAERIRARKRLGDVFKSVLKHGVASGEFPKQNLDASAACIVGAFTEALVGPIGPSRKSLRDKERLVGAICTFCLRAVGARE
ncbi:TetR/AcrR family transcriptional regulator [Xanthomonadaceae bacterium JHOS43]|nr:TetR/AcrR family transcriptional regulator [Xanthomonadaceae bacterium JHOS43]MCX7562320.1 TetR/AcrR family transcriptional regulator [Xanthomonadaceae bacterium XH05]